MAGNTFGAPTEGLGQAVTFAGDQEPAPEQSPITRMSGLRLGPTGGGAVAEGIQITPTVQAVSAFGKSLVRVAEQTMDADFQRKRAQAVIDGMQQAAAGETVQAVINGQSKVDMFFGTGLDAVAGARSYTGQNAANMWAADVGRRREEMAKLTAPEASKAFADSISRIDTGDSRTNVIATQQAMNMLPAMMRSQTADYVQYTQKEAANAYVTAVSTAGAALQAVGGNDPGALEAAKQTVLASLAPPPGMSEGTLHTAVLSMAGAAARNGHVRLLSTLNDPEILKGLPMGVRDNIPALLDTARANARETWQRNNIAQVQDLSRLTSKAPFTPGMTSNVVKAAIEEINKQYQRDTGDDEPLLSVANQVKTIQGVEDGIRQERFRQDAVLRARTEANAKVARTEAEAAARRSREDASVQAEMSNARAATVDGDFSLVRKQGSKFDSKDVEDMGIKTVTSLLQPVDMNGNPRATLPQLTPVLRKMQDTDGRSLNGLQRQFSTNMDDIIQSEKPSDRQIVLLQAAFRAYQENPESLALLVGPSNVKRYVELFPGLVDLPNIGERIAHIKRTPATVPTLDAKTTAGLAKAAGVDPSTQGGSLLLSEIAREAKDLGWGSAQMIANHQVLKGAAQSRNLAVVGNYAWRKLPNEEPFYQSAVDSGMLPENAKFAVGKLLDRYSKDAQTIRYEQGVDRFTSLPCLYVTQYMSDGRQVHHRITAGDIKDEQLKQQGLMDRRGAISAGFQSASENMGIIGP